MIKREIHFVKKKLLLVFKIILSETVMNGIINNLQWEVDLSRQIKVRNNKIRMEKYH
jgi:hypothetical protein